MSNCLVTKLKSSVNEDSLRKLGELMCELSKGKQYYSAVTGESSSIRAIDGAFSDGSKESNTPVEVTTDTKVAISNKYKLYSLSLTLREFDLDELRYCSNMGELRLVSAGGIKGDLSALKNLQKLTKLQVSTEVKYSNPNIIGDISVLASLKALNLVTLSYTGISGDIASLNGSNIKQAYFNTCTKLSGSIDTLILPNCTELYVPYCPNITGSAATFKANNPSCNLVYNNSGITE